MNIREFKAKLIALINESKIPLDIIELVLKNSCYEIHEQIELIYAAEKNRPEPEQAADPEPEKAEE